MEHPTITLFRPLLTMTTRDDRVAYLRAHPVLTSPYYVELLAAFAATLDGPTRGNAEAAFALRQEVFAMPKELPNPIGEAFGAVLRGSMTERQALEVVGRRDSVVELMFPVVDAAAGAAEKIAREDWRGGVLLMRIVLAALDARRAAIPENQQAMERTAVETWLMVATMALGDVPDGRLYRDAVGRAEALADLPEETVESKGQILHRLGVLHLDPYVAGRSSHDLPQQMRAWQRRLEEEYGDELAGIPEDELRMPEIEQALPMACAYFRRAAERRSGAPKGQTLKAWAQALVWQHLCGVTVDPREITTLAAAALDLLPADDFAAEHAELTGFLTMFGRPAQPARDGEDAAPARSLACRLSERAMRALDRLRGRPDPDRAGPSTLKEVSDRAKAMLATPLADLVERFGSLETENKLLQSAQAVAEDDRRLALTLMLAAQPLILEREEDRQAIFYQNLLAAMRRALAPHAPSADRRPVSDLVAALAADAQKDRGKREALPYALLWLAASTTRTDQEAEAGPALDLAWSLGDEVEPDLAPLFGRVRAMIDLGGAVNAVNESRYALAARRYAAAMGSHLRSGQPRVALDVLRRMLDLTRHGEEGTIEAIVAALASNALALESATGRAGTELIQSACRSVTAQAGAAGRFNPQLLLLILFVAKGRRFAAMLSHPDLPSLLEEPRVAAWESEIAALAARAPREPWSSALDQDTILTSYITPKEKRGGTSAADQLRNLRIQFDSWLNDRIGAERDDDAWVPTVDGLSDLLDEETVLLIQYLGQAASGALSLLTLLVSREGMSIARGEMADFPMATVELKSGEETVRANPLGLTVGRLRETLLQAPPEGMRADPEALRLLADDVGLLLGGGLDARLAALREGGKRHLWIWPHGPFHYYPFHLLGPADAPLAQDWCVTYLPSLQLVRREAPEGASERKTSLGAIGVDFEEGNPQGLPAMTEPGREAAQIAAAFGTEPLTGPAANRAGLVEALRRSRYVHIATHGQHDVSAPAFQRIFVRPEAGDPGVVHAYELLKLDLCGLDLVTLSACETALGRFDAGDNLRGFPAALLAAGATTIVGTLWEVETNAAASFFETFYATLRSTGSKRTAFREAQRRTRAAYPDYWDWGAFQLIGRS